jgi:hypothetical protein
VPTRPRFGDLAPAQRIRIDDAGDETRVRGRFGNPEPLPYRSDNLGVYGRTYQLCVRYRF